MVRSRTPILCAAVLAAADWISGASRRPPPRRFQTNKKRARAKWRRQLHVRGPRLKPKPPKIPDGSFFSAGWSGPLPQCHPRPTVRQWKSSESEPLVRAAAARHQLNPDLIKAVIRQESGFRPCAVSDQGAMGLIQLMPDTAQSLKTKDPFDPAQNIEGRRELPQADVGAVWRYIRLSPRGANAGPEKVDAGPKPAVPDIPETRDCCRQYLQFTSWRAGGVGLRNWCRRYQPNQYLAKY